MGLNEADRYRAWLATVRPATDLCRRAPHFCGARVRLHESRGHGASSSRSMVLRRGDGEPEFDRQKYNHDVQTRRTAAEHAERVFRAETTGVKRHKGYHRRAW